jgi:hypothetical protein
VADVFAVVSRTRNSSLVVKVVAVAAGSSRSSRDSRSSAGVLVWWWL